jgi:hypothetical protein
MCSSNRLFLGLRVTVSGVGHPKPIRVRCPRGPGGAGRCALLCRALAACALDLERELIIKSICIELTEALSPSLLRIGMKLSDPDLLQTAER